MQILLNSNEVSEIVLGYVQVQLGLDDSNVLTVECHDDGTISVYVNEETGSETAATPAEAKPTRRRQSRRPKAAAAPVAEPGNDTPVVTTTAEVVTPSEPVTPEAAGETTPETSASPGTEPEVDPSNAVDTTVVVEEVLTVVPETTAASTVVDADAPVEEEPPRKPTQSLFANLRKPNNG